MSYCQFHSPFSCWLKKKTSNTTMNNHISKNLNIQSEPKVESIKSTNKLQLTEVESPILHSFPSSISISVQKVTSNMERSQTMELTPTGLLQAPKVHSRHCTKLAVEIVCSHETSVMRQQKPRCRSNLCWEHFFCIKNAFQRPQILKSSSFSVMQITDFVSR